MLEAKGVQSDFKFLWFLVKIVNTFPLKRLSHEDLARFFKTVLKLLIFTLARTGIAPRLHIRTDLEKKVIKS